MVGAQLTEVVLFSSSSFLIFDVDEIDGNESDEEEISFMYQYPDATHQLMERLTQTIIEYLVLQVNAGAQMLEVFDTQAGCLSPALWEEFVEPYLTRIATTVKKELKARGLEVVPMTVFPMGAHWALNSLSYSDYDVIAIDWHTSPVWARSQVGDRVALQGNLDPSALFADEKQLRKLVTEMAQQFGLTGTIANLGHGMLPSHTPDALYIFADEIKTTCQSLSSSPFSSSISSSSSLLTPAAFIASLSKNWAWVVGGMAAALIAQRYSKALRF